MKKCRITVEKVYPVKGGELKSLHSIEIGEKSLTVLCQYLAELVANGRDIDVLKLYELLRAY